jgi:hypothetical protein
MGVQIEMATVKRRKGRGGACKELNDIATTTTTTTKRTTTAVRPFD